MNKALLVMDLINDIANENGSVGRDGFYNQANKYKVIENTARAISHCRKIGIPIIYVVVGFNKNYPEWNKNSKVFKHVKDKKQVLLNTWATQICDELKPIDGEIIITKNRIDPFYNTNLELILKNMDIEMLYLCGISSDMVILSTVFSGHDRDYIVRPLVDCISSNDEYSNECALNIMKKLSLISSVEKLMKEEK